MDTINFFQGSDFNFDTVHSPTILPEALYLSMDIQQTNQYAPQLRRSRPRASLACIPCRSRHLKCDAKPVCSRCQLDQRPCTYTKSRRGGKRRLNIQEATLDAVPKSYSSTGQMETPDSLSNAAYLEPQSDLTSNVARIHNNLMDTRSGIEAPHSQEKLLDLYYENFHDAHPIVLPRERLKTRLQTDSESLRCLIPVLEYIGSIYNADESSKELRQVAHHILTDGPLPHNGFSVQALLLFAISVHCCDEYDAGDAILDLATDIALSIQMLRQPFAHANGDNDLVLVECWRRTAWCLFLTDTVFAAVSHRLAHRLQMIEVDVDLPCEDQEYETGYIPTSRTLTDYENREFEEEEIIFSSFAYFIDAGRILSSTISMNQPGKDPSEQALNAADTKLVTWFLYLPKCKQEVMRDNGKVDEIMFLAHLWVNTEKLLVHRLQSQLQYSNIEGSSKCTPKLIDCASQKSTIFHTSKVLEAMDAAFKLFALPSSYLKHTPMVTCSLALFIMAQVSACNHIFQKGSSRYIAGRERVRMGLGVLRTHERYWGLAKRSVREVRGVARQLLMVSLTPQSMEGNIDLGGSEEFAHSGNGGSSSEADIVDTSDMLDDQCLGFYFGDMAMSAF